MGQFRNHPRWKRYVAGMIGGAAGTAAMGLFMKGMSSLKKSTSGEQPQQRKPEEQYKPQHDISLVGRQHHEGESATAAVGRIVYEKVARKEPGDRTKNKLSNAVHWVYGIEQGGMYGLLRGRERRLDIAGGAAFGAVLWMLGDEVAVPLLGLAEGPKAHPKSMHVETLGAHVVYGMTTALTTQLVGRAL